MKCDPLKQWIHLSKTLKKSDPSLAPVVRAIGPPALKFDRNYFRALAASILWQQLNGSVAKIIVQRFSSLAPPFPTPENVLRFHASKFRNVGISRQKTIYLKDLSRHWSEENWRKGWNLLSEEELISRLCVVKGVGRWTAQMFLIFSLGKPDVLPTGDYSIRKGVMILRGLKMLPTEKELPSHVPNWEGLASIASWYVWKGMEKGLIQP